MKNKNNLIIRSGFDPDVMCGYNTLHIRKDKLVIFENTIKKFYSYKEMFELHMYIIFNFYDTVKKQIESLKDFYVHFDFDCDGDGKFDVLIGLEETINYTDSYCFTINQPVHPAFWLSEETEQILHKYVCDIIETCVIKNYILNNMREKELD